MFDKFIGQRGRVPNLFRIAALRPTIAQTLAAHLDAVMGPGEVSGLLKELIACRVSQINSTPYCLASHSKLARKQGGTDAQLAALAGHWTAPQIVEITSVATAFSLFNRFADALNIPITT
jgi:AhpD family alkylhydroperoxidase